jgi:hypothetical protein
MKRRLALKREVNKPFTLHMPVRTEVTHAVNKQTWDFEHKKILAVHKQVWVSGGGEGAIGYLCASSTAWCSAASVQLSGTLMLLRFGRRAPKKLVASSHIHSTLKYSCMQLALQFPM